MYNSTTTTMDTVSAMTSYPQSMKKMVLQEVHDNFIKEQELLYNQTTQYVNNEIIHEELKILRKQLREVLAGIKLYDAFETSQMLLEDNTCPPPKYKLFDAKVITERMEQLKSKLVPEATITLYKKAVMQSAVGPPSCVEAIMAMQHVEYNMEEDTRDIRISFMRNRMTREKYARALTLRRTDAEILTLMLAVLNRVLALGNGDESVRQALNAECVSIAKKFGTKHTLVIAPGWASPSYVAIPTGTKKRDASAMLV